MNEREPKLAVIYCRVSDGKGSKRGDGLRSQRFSDLAVRVEERNRPGLADMIKHIREPRDTRHSVIIAKLIVSAETEMP